LNIFIIHPKDTSATINSLVVFKQVNSELTAKR